MSATARPPPSPASRRPGAITATDIGDQTTTSKTDIGTSGKRLDQTHDDADTYMAAQHPQNPIFSTLLTQPVR